MENINKIDVLREEIANLSKTIDQKLMILTNVSCNDTEFLKSIQNDFSQNLNFTLSFIEGLQKPEKTYISHGISKKCYHGDNYPHLNHTFNPQLNSITDMLEEILVSIKFQKNKEKEEPSIINEIEQMLNKHFQKEIPKKEEVQNKVDTTNLKVRPPIRL